MSGAEPFFVMVQVFVPEYLFSTLNGLVINSFFSQSTTPPSVIFETSLPLSVMLFAVLTSNVIV